MKKALALILALSMMLGCTCVFAEGEETCTYTIFNETGEKVTELYVTDNVTGEKSESAIYAVYTFCRKLGQTAADYGGLTLLDKVGYTKDMATRGFVPGVSEGILKICTLIPAVTYTLIFLLYRFGYPLTKERLEPVYAYVRQTNAAAENAAQPEES